MTPRPQRGKVWLVGAGPGDPDLITQRGIDVLSGAEVVLHDALSHPDLLAHARAATIIDVGKRYGERSPHQSLITGELVRLAREGRRVVRLKGGDPMLFARGAEEALALREAGIEFEVVPGISSAIAASEFAGISLTHRDDSSSVTFITGSDQEGKEWSPEAWKKLATATGTICVYMGMRRIEAIAQAIIDGGRSPSTPSAVVMWGARPEQRTVTAELRDIATVARAAGLSSPAIIIVGEVVRLRETLNWYESKPLFGKRILLPRPVAQARATVAALRARAAIPVVAPAIEIRPPEDGSVLRDSVKRAADYDVVVFTSQNGVDAFFEALEDAKLDARAFGRAMVAAIGPKTAEALRRRGVRADLAPREFVAESLAEALLGLGGIERVLLPRAEVAREVLPERLRERGIEVDVVTAYVTRPVTGAARERLVRDLQSGCDAVLFTSSSMVDAVVDALGGEAITTLERPLLVSIGPVTSRRLRERGLRVDVEASEYTVEGALDALELHGAGPTAS